MKNAKRTSSMGDEADEGEGSSNKPIFISYT